MMRKALPAVAAIALSVAGLVAVPASPAQAWVWSGSVQLQGSSVCAGSGTSWVWVSAPNGESGWATSGRGRYYKAFNRVPSGGMTVRINYGNSAFTCHDYVYVRRPLAGTGLTVNLYKLFANG